LSNARLPQHRERSHAARRIESAEDAQCEVFMGRTDDAIARRHRSQPTFPRWPPVGQKDCTIPHRPPDTQPGFPADRLATARRRSSSYERTVLQSLRYSRRESPGRCRAVQRFRISLPAPSGSVVWPRAAKARRAEAQRTRRRAAVLMRLSPRVMVRAGSRENLAMSAAKTTMRPERHATGSFTARDAGCRKNTVSSTIR
jgi:hypothetical protein